MGLWFASPTRRPFFTTRGEVVAVSPASTGREGYNTPTGKHRVIAKDIDHRSSLYGAYERDGRVVMAGVDVRKDRKPPGAVFVGAPMPYYLQIAPSYGLHPAMCPATRPLMDASTSKSLGQTLLLRSQGGHASVDLSLGTSPRKAPARIRKNLPHPYGT